MTRSGTAPSTRAIAVVTALAVGWLIAVVGAAPVSAHASLVRSNPADDASLVTAPKTVTLTFDENVRMPSVILVTAADGKSVVRGKPSVVDNTAQARVSIPTSGDYTVVYRVVSADGHPVAGRLSFAVGSGNPSSGHVVSSSGASTRVIGMVAALALLCGVGLLTIRRWAPNLWSSS